MSSRVEHSGGEHTAPLRLVLASASPARLATLRRAGVDPYVMISEVDEDATVSAGVARYGELGCDDVALLLARAKCEDVAARIDAGQPREGTDGQVLVLGCDSVLDLDGQVHGKPTDAEVARQRWRVMRGSCGVLHTGHWLIDTRDAGAGGSGATFGAVASTTVWFADVCDAEIDAYVATGEPLRVAGAFTIDGLGGPFIERIEGDPHNVVGVSLPLVRSLLGELGLSWYQLRRP